MMNKSNKELNTKEMIQIAGGTGPLTTGPLTTGPLGWPNGWDFTTGPLASCDPPMKTGPLGYPYLV